MAIKILTKPTATAPAVVDDEVPNEIPRHGGDKRPKIRDGASAKFSYYSRASSFGKVIEDTYNLDKWDKRVVVWGLSRDRTLYLAAQAVPAWEDHTDEIAHKRYRDELNSIVDRAREVAKSDRAAERGTAFHTLSEQADAGADLSHLDPTTLRGLNQWRRLMGIFRILSTETFVVNDEWRAAGSFDRLVELLVDVTIRDGDGEVLAVLPAGTVLIVDLKTGRSSAWFGVGYAVQLATYAGGCPYVHVDDSAAARGDDGRRPWPGGVTPSQDWAVIPHVPVDNPDEAALVWVDLSIGRRCGDLVAAVRDARRDAKGAFHEVAVDTVVEIVPGEVVTVPEPRSDEQVVADLDEGFVETMVELIRSAPDVDTIGRLYAQHAEDWRPQFDAVADARCAELGVGVDPATPPLQPAEVCDTHGEHRGTADCVECIYPAEQPAAEQVPQYRIADLLRVAPTEADVMALYAEHTDRWSSYLGKVADARLDELSAAQVPA